MFPKQNNSIQNNNSNNDKTAITGKSFLFDFNVGDFILDDSGNLTSITNTEALKMWITKILKTDKNKFVVYDGTDYGITNLKGLVNSGYPFEFIKSEIEHNIKETLLNNTAIKSVENFTFERNKRVLKVSFNISTIYGTITSEVNI